MAQNMDQHLGVELTDEKIQGSSPPIRILDCTFRDGGYYTDWVYGPELSRRYIEAMDACAIDIVELGFRMPAGGSFLGPYAYTTDHWINRLGIPDGLVIGVMCNGSDLLRTGDPVAVIDTLFSEAASSRVELVRIAAHFRELEACDPAVRRLRELGYRVGINLMQAGGRSRKEIFAKASVVRDWPIDVLYFADSIGNMGPREVAQTIDVLAEAWPGEIGFHAHNNMGRALDNALAAIDAGATWIDATVLGMGRGAGNACLEYLMLELDRYGIRQAPRLDALLALVLEDFSELRDQFDWGPNLFYHLSAQYNVHPTYVQEMLSDDRYTKHEIVAALERLGDLGASGFSENRLHEVTRGSITPAEGTWSAEGWLSEQTVLIVGPGSSGAEHKEGVLDYIRDTRPFVLCLNSNAWFPDAAVGAWIACNPERLALDRDYYARRSGTLVVPAECIPFSVSTALDSWGVNDYGVRFDAERFVAGNNTAVVPAPLVLLYALALASAAGARDVRLVGVDGFEVGDPRHRELEAALKIYHESEQALDIVALTPTALTVPRSSVYAPRVRT